MQRFAHAFCSIKAKIIMVTRIKHLTWVKKCKTLNIIKNSTKYEDLSRNLNLNEKR